VAASGKYVRIQASGGMSATAEVLNCCCKQAWLETAAIGGHLAVLAAFS